ncbi:MAG: diguanylate cyclase response regulator [Planctomycetota bacterium]|nr:MAG: diguanylate cyclase response regulator [Planctomycetota bacterium]
MELAIKFPDHPRLMNILIAEDDAVTCRLLTRALESWGHTVFAAADGSRAWDLYHEESINLIVSDWVMPGIDGPELCRRIRASNIHSSNPAYIILLTGKDSVESLAAGFAAGADDYIAKPFDNAELQARVHAGMRIIALQKELIDAREQVERLALTDSMTGLLNRRALVDALRRDEDRMRRQNRPIGIVLADLDRFKKVNDTWGHESGDRVLEMVAKCMQASVRTGDYAGRWGGEEFLLVLPGADIIQSAEVAERCRTLIESQAISLDNRNALGVTCSFGVASTEGVGRCDIMDLVQQADKAMYWAKDAGRNRVKIHLGTAGPAGGGRAA